MTLSCIVYPFCIIAATLFSSYSDAMCASASCRVGSNSSPKAAITFTPSLSNTARSCCSIQQYSLKILVFRGLPHLYAVKPVQKIIYHIADIECHFFGGRRIQSAFSESIFSENCQTLPYSTQIFIFPISTSICSSSISCSGLVCPARTSVSEPCNSVSWGSVFFLFRHLLPLSRIIVEPSCHAGWSL